MPYVNIKVTGDEEAPSVEQKKALIAGVTDLLVKVLGKNPSSLVVVIDEVSMDNYGIAGQTVRERRKQKH